MKTLHLIALIVVFVVVINVLAVQLGLYILFDRDLPPSPMRDRWMSYLSFLLTAKTILASVNTVLLISVLIIYLEIYRNTGSEFSLGLVIFSMALLIYSLTSNPIIHLIAGFRLTGLGPFTMLPDLFSCIASAILLYLSQQ
jgi:hypothetical protein